QSYRVRLGVRSGPDEAQLDSIAFQFSLVSQSTQCAKQRTWISKIRIDAACMHDDEVFASKPGRYRGKISFIVAIRDCSDLVIPQMGISRAQRITQMRRAR